MFNNLVDDFRDQSSTSLLSKINNIVSLKRKTSFFKKKSKLHSYLLFRTNFLKSNKLTSDTFSHFLKNNATFNFSDSFIFGESQQNSLENDFDKLIELKRKTFWIFYQNRTILKNFFFNSKIRQFQITKFFSKLTKKSGRDLFYFFENSLFNSLVRSKLILSWKDSIFYIKNGCVFVNGNVCKNIFFTVNVGDFVQISIDDDYFNFFKKKVDSNLKLMNNVANKVWQINRLRGNFYKQTTSNIPNWIHELIFFYDDAPHFLEIDYSILSFSFVYVNDNYNEYNFFFLKFLNYFMSRHYNWKYII
jgi:hypothetical protein